jgi:hypothetical protein
MVDLKTAMTWPFLQGCGFGKTWQGSASALPGRSYCRVLTPSRHRPASWPILVRLVGRLAVTPPTRSPIPCNDENRAEADKLRKEVSKIQELMLAASAIDFFDEGQDDGDNHR